jgi:hypothetical protein
MNGQLRVESELNKGSRFAVTLTFPLHMPVRKDSLTDATKPALAESLKVKNPKAAESLTPLSYIEGKLMMMKAQVQQEKKNEFATTTSKVELQGNSQKGTSVSTVPSSGKAPAETDSTIQTPRSTQENSLVVLYAEVDDFALENYSLAQIVMKIY